MLTRLVDALGWFQTSGGLGGARLSSRARSLGAIFSSTIPAIRVDFTYPACGEGDCTIDVDDDGNLVFTPPDGLPGDPVRVEADEDGVISGADANKAIRVHRDPDLQLSGQAVFRLVNVMNGFLSHSNVDDDHRQHGSSTYRAIFLLAQGPWAVKNVRIWFPDDGGQASYAMALETPVSDAIQVIADETVRPTGLSWSTPTSEGVDVISSLAPGQSMGLWINRVLPPGGVVSPKEDVKVAFKYKGA